MLNQFITALKITEQELIDELSEVSEITQHKKGDFIIKNNQFIKVLKIVLDGKVRVYQEQESKRF